MIIHKYPAVMALGVCALLLPGVGGVQYAAAQDAGTFPSFIPFNLTQFEIPEGVAVDKVGNVYVNIRQSPMGPLPFSDQIWKFSPAGAKTVLADFGAPGGGGCGLAVDAVGNVYMARTETAAPYNGVYRVDAEGNIALVPGTQNIVFPDGLAFDKQGTLYITEIYSHGPASGTFAQGGDLARPEGRHGGVVAAPRPFERASAANLFLASDRG